MFLNRCRRALVASAAFAFLAASGAILAQASPRPIDFFAIGGYNYDPNDPFEPNPVRRPNAVPANVRALEGQKIKIEGNAMALDYSSGMTSEFLLHPTADACAYGATPRINDWIHVKMAGARTARIHTGVEIVVVGTFHIREEVEDGRVIGLYTMDADSTGPIQ